MFKSSMGIKLVCGIGMCVALTASQSHAARYRLMAVKKGAVNITPTNNVTAAVGEEITCEIWIDQFGPDFSNRNPPGARSYEAVIDGLAGAISGGNGSEGPILPKGWDAPFPSVPCTSNAQCLFASNLTCNLSRGICTGPNHQPQQGIFLTTSDPEFIFLGFTIIADVNLSGLDAKYFATINDSFFQEGTGVYYGGTLILQVKQFACGTFTFGFRPNTAIADSNFMTDALLSFPPVYPTLEPLTINVGTCPQIKLQSSPPDCAVDARRPHPPTSSATLEGITTLLLTFDSSTNGMTAGQFSSRLVPTGGLLVGHTVTPLPNNQLQVNYTRQAQPSPLDQNRWRCTRHIATNRENCVGGLAGDVNQNLITNSDDVTALRTLLSPPVVSAPLHQCDLDRSARCTPADLLTAIDLINGADQFISYNGATISSSGSPVTCPSQ